MLSNSIWICLISIGLLVGSYTVTHGQTNTRISGRILSLNGESLPVVSVILRKLNADSTFVGFTLSEADGRYELLFDADTTHYQLTAQLLGFATERALITRQATTSRFDRNFVLKPYAFSLKEVIVRAKVIPLSSSGDTTTYQARAFADGSERSVEDLLKKLPGIKVSENGTITVRGKPIEKVLIEGEDLFSRNYTLISRSLAASLIDKVEAIDNFTENPLLHSVEKSGKTVLNLSIKEDRRKIVFGNGEVQVGTVRRYEAKGTLFSLFQRLKVAAIGQANTVGTDPVPDTEYHLTADDGRSATTIGTNGYSPLLTPQTVDTPPLSSERYTFNKARLGAVSVGYRQGERLHLKAYSYLSTDDRQIANTAINTFLLDTLRISVRDSTRWNSRPHIWYTQAQLVYNQPNRFSLKIGSDWKKTLTATNVAINTQNIILPEQVQTVLHEQFDVYRHQFEWVKRLSKKNVLTFDGMIKGVSLPQTTTVRSRRFADFLNADPMFGSIVQDAKLSIRDYQAKLYWKGSYQDTYYALGMGSIRQQYALRTMAFLKTTATKSDSARGFSNEALYTTTNYFLDGSYSFRYKKFVYSFTSTLQYTQLSYRENTQPVELTRRPLLWSPTIGVAVNVGTQRRLLFGFARTQTLPTIQQLSGSYLIGDYRTLTGGTSTLHVVTSDALVARYTDFNFTKFYTILATLNAGRELSPYVYEAAITNNLSLLRLLPYGGSLYQLGGQIEVSRFSSRLNTNVQFTSNATLSDLASIQNQYVQHSRLAKLDIGISGITAFDQAVNAELGSRLTWIRLADETNEQRRYSLSQSLLIRPRLVVSIRPSSTVRFRVVNEGIYWNNSGNTTTILLTDTQLQWNPIKKSYTLELLGNNLLNIRNIAYTQFTGNYLIAQKQFLIQPRYVSIRAEWRF